VNEWLAQAETYIRERQPPSKVALETQKQFFQNLNESSLKEMVTAGQDLVKSLSPQQQVMDYLEKS